MKIYVISLKLQFEIAMDLCIICKKPVEDYKPQMCCNGTDCGCQGLPVEPCLCEKCEPLICDPNFKKETK